MTTPIAYIVALMCVLSLWSCETESSPANEVGGPPYSQSFATKVEFNELYANDSSYRFFMFSPDGKVGVLDCAMMPCPPTIIGDYEGLYINLLDPDKHIVVDAERDGQNVRFQVVTSINDSTVTADYALSFGQREYGPILIADITHNGGFAAHDFYETLDFHFD